jgi:hypothetical protein
MYVLRLGRHDELWFAGESGTLYVFKVNRRPWARSRPSLRRR